MNSIEITGVLGVILISIMLLLTTGIKIEETYRKHAEEDMAILQERYDRDGKGSVESEFLRKLVLSKNEYK